MAGFAAAAGFTLLFQSGQRPIVVLTTFGPLHLDAKRHVELAQKELLGSYMNVTLGQVLKSMMSHEARTLSQ